MRKGRPTEPTLLLQYYQVMTFQRADKFVLHMLACVCSMAYTILSLTHNLAFGYYTPGIMLGIQPILFCYPYSFLVVTTAPSSVNSIFLHIDEKAHFFPSLS